MTWQGRNSLDDDGDGLPNLLDRGVGAKLFRVYAGDGLPADFATRDAPLLAWLDRRGHRYDITTDVALARGAARALEDHKGVILPSDVRWLPRGPAAAPAPLRARRRHASRRFGIDSLRRQVSLTRRGRMIDPTPPATTDVFGVRLRPLRAPAQAQQPRHRRRLDRLLRRHRGRLRALLARARRPTSASRPPPARSPRTPRPGGPVIAASRLGKGLVFRFGVPELAAHLSARANDPNTAALLDRTWTLLSH